MKNPELTVNLLTLTDPIKVEMVINILRKNGIPALVQRRAASTVHPFTVNGLAETKILVTVKDLALSKDILKNYGLFLPT